MTVARAWKPVLLGVLLVLGSVLFAVRATAAVSCFTDVDDSAWYEPYVCAMAGRGILAGYSDGTFDPDGTITRAETATIASRILDATIEHGDIVVGADGHGWAPWGSFSPPSFLWNWMAYTHASGDGSLGIGLQAPTMIDGVEYALRDVEFCWSQTDGGSVVSVDIFTSNGTSNIYLGGSDTPSSGCSTIDVWGYAPQGASVGVALGGGASARIKLFGIRSTWTPAWNLPVPASTPLNGVLHDNG